MEMVSISEIIARILGPIYLVVAAGIFSDTKGYRKMAQDFLKSRPMCYHGGILVLLIGISILVLHGSWTGGLDIVIGLIGLLATLKGVLLVLDPPMLGRLLKSSLRNDSSLRRLAVFVVVLGLYLTASGYALF